MVLTMLEADVDAGRWDDLVHAYTEETKKPEPRIVETFLVQDTKAPTRWRILTLWASAEALQAMRGEGTPAGVLIFRAAGAEPALSVHGVRAQAVPR